MSGDSKEIWYEKMLAKFGSDEAIKAEMRRRAQQGKGTSRPGAGFAANKELASQMGKTYGKGKRARQVQDKV